MSKSPDFKRKKKRIIKRYITIIIRKLIKYIKRRNDIIYN